MNFTDKQTNPLLPTPLLSGSHMFARLQPSPLLTLSHHLHTFACPHSLLLFGYLCFSTAPYHICKRLLSISVCSLPLIAYIHSPLFSPPPSMLAASLSHSPDPTIFMQSLILLLAPSPYVCPPPPTAYVSFPSPSSSPPPHFCPLCFTSHTLVACLSYLTHTLLFCTSLVQVVAYLLIYVSYFFCLK